MLDDEDNYNWKFTKKEFFECAATLCVLVGGVVLANKGLNNLNNNYCPDENLQLGFISVKAFDKPFNADLDGKPGNETYIRIGNKFYAVKDSAGTAKLVPYTGIAEKVGGK